MRVFLVSLAFCVVAALGKQADPVYDHQQIDYTTHFKPFTVSGEMTRVRPYFAPTHAINVTYNLIESATSTIDIHIAGFQPWTKACNLPSNLTAHSCVGCDADTMRWDWAFYYRQILNAVHTKNVTVRVLTNDYGVPTCPGNASALDVLALNGVQVGFYNQTTYTHSKVIIVDGKTVSISSVNWDEIAFMWNREAGMLIDGTSPGGAKLVEWYEGVFEDDFQKRYPYTVNGTYDEEQLAILTDRRPMSQFYPNVYPPNGSYITPDYGYMEVTGNVTAMVAPDFVHDDVLEQLSAAKTDFKVMMYFVANGTFCEALYDAHTRGVNVTVLVSPLVLGFDNYISTVCYESLIRRGLPVYAAPSYYTFSHQKFWIRDLEEVTLSTGDWTRTDTPPGTEFPTWAHGGPNWVQTNRDFLVKVADEAVAGVYAKVVEEDLKHATPWKPSPPPPSHVDAVFE